MKVLFCKRSTSIALLALVFAFQIAEVQLQGADTMRGVVYDQDGNPLSGVLMTFKVWSEHAYTPLPFSKTWVTEQTFKSTTDSNGIFTFRYTGHGHRHGVDFVSESKTGYRQDGPETDYMWRPYETGTAPQWTMHLVSEALMRQEQIKSMEFSSVPFYQSGQIGVNLAEGAISSATNSDIVFEWQRLHATTNHGDYGRLTVFAPKGGVWFWEQDRLFAPKEGYEKGMVFFFDPKTMGAYMKQHRMEFFVKSRDGQVYARVYAQINTADSTLSIRARANANTSRFVAVNGGSYAIGVYGSLSESYLNPAIPWWIPIRPSRGQVILMEERLRTMATNFPSYFAEHYQTPKDVLEGMANSSLIHDHYVPQYLARNVAAPTNVLQRLIEIDPAGSRWFGKDARATLQSPDDVKRFLISK